MAEKQKVLLKRSSVPGKMPSEITGSTVDLGELFLNIASGDADNFLTTLRAEGSSAVTSDYIKWSDDVANEKKFATKEEVMDNELVVSTIITKINESVGLDENSDSVLPNGESLSEAIITLQNNSVGAPMITITYSELKTLRDESKLIPGMKYRITDYNTTTSQGDTRSAAHQFDIIVTALDNHTLSEEASACLHDGDTYFSSANAKLEAWKLWYCLDNDVNRFAWADVTNGKGVIYRMIDEWNNDVPYDFKNVIYLAASTFECSMYGMSHTYTMNGDIITIGGVNYYGYKRTRTESGPPPPTTPLYVTETILSTSMTLYTINGEVASPYTSASVESVENKEGEFYTFGGTSDLSVGTSTIYSNIISPYFVQSIQTLNRNTFGTNCYNNSFGNDCSFNSFGNNCYNNSFGPYGYYNSFGNNCNHNSFGSSCNSNSFGNYCSSNSFGNYCSSNSFGNDCSFNSFGNDCSFNSFGNDCDDISFGNDANNLKTYYTYNSFGNGCEYINLANDEIASSTNQVKYYKFAQGLQGTYSSPITITTVRNRNYETKVAKNSAGEIKIYCEADLIA